MKWSTKFRLPSNQTALQLALRHFFTLLFIVTTACLPLSAQIQQESKCQEETPTFTGFAEPTLCEKNANFTCETQIGAGTQFPKSSLLGSFTTGNVCVVGNFVVDAPFTFQNAVVKINPGVTISIAESPNGYDGGSYLGIDNSKLFACNGLWKGINLGFLSAISTWNNSQIEDAETAIYANGACGLSIQQTTFNRNRVGIELVTPFPNIFVPGPLIWIFSDNFFTCNAPLNGTVSEITNAGIKLKNSFLYPFQSTGNNTFSDIKYGIYSEGSSSYIGAQRLIFQRIRLDGIYMEKGNIKLGNSRFENGYDKGINIASAVNVNISDNCYFEWTELIPPYGNGASYRKGIYIGSTALASSVNIIDSDFQSNLISEYKNVRAVEIMGGNIGAGSQFLIEKCLFKMLACNSFGIFIIGDFPKESQIDIFDNNFDLSIGNLPWSSYGIHCFGGNKNNLSITENRFYNNFSTNLNHSHGIELIGSEGTNNLVSNNDYMDGILYKSYDIGIYGQDFKNTKFCANDFLNTNRSFYFAGLNDGIELTGNNVYGSNFITIYQDSWIEDNEHSGNQWTLPTIAGIPPELTPYITPQAKCEALGLLQFSEFFVHAPQSTTLFGSNFNPFHPKDLEPDGDFGEWWIQENGTPQSGCGPSLESGNSKLRLAVANGSLVNTVNNPAIVWQAERALYFRLKDNPFMEIGNSTYSSFRTSKTGSNVDKFYQVATALDVARNSNSTLLADAGNNHTLIDNLLIQIDASNLAWQNATTPTEKLNAQNIKKQHLGVLMDLLQGASNLQTSYNLGLQNALVNVQQINNTINPLNKYEEYEKTSNNIFISYLQNGGMTTEQKDQLEIIAAVCPKDGGMAVYKSQGLLPECLQVSRKADLCYPISQPFTEVVPTNSRSNKENWDQYGLKVQLSPNPAVNTTNLFIPIGKQCEMRLVNAFGQTIKMQQITSAQTILDLNALTEGVYYLNLLFSDGERECVKLVKSK